ncbi:hypothetical protein THOG11_40184 [Vibrio harveyi]|nr:hypothetical protein TH15OA1_300016 [Vibrio harveyi]CAH1532996.1 hypothetical protein VHARVF571_320016 [Vibrio harveyi]CAH1548796.1 hypothetical protein THOD03_120011 [Vibrio harveyi]CAH1577078.1 hypothetical protein THOG11_40184 [Vibrio harveyi]
MLSGLSIIFQSVKKIDLDQFSQLKYPQSSGLPQQNNINH